MKDNIKPEHYRTGEIDLFESWYLTYPFEQYRAIMQSHAEKYLRRNKVDRAEDLGKAIYCLKILREKEIEHDKQKSKTTKEAFADLDEAFGKINFNKLLRKHKISDLLATYENGGENGK